MANAHSIISQINRVVARGTGQESVDKLEELMDALADALIESTPEAAVKLLVLLDSAHVVAMVCFTLIERHVESGNIRAARFYASVSEAYEGLCDRPNTGLAYSRLAALVNTREEYANTLRVFRGMSIPDRCLAVAGLMILTPSGCPAHHQIIRAWKSCMKELKGRPVEERAVVYERFALQAEEAEITADPIIQAMLNAFSTFAQLGSLAPPDLN